jgi:hypothetical protein
LTGKIPIIGTHKGIGLHAFQPQSRISSTVIPEIDAVLEIEDPNSLFEWSRDIRKSPESRLLETNKILSIFRLAAENRAVRPDLDLDLCVAVTAGCDSLGWADPGCYASMLDASKYGPFDERPVPRDPEHRAQIEQAKAELHAVERDEYERVGRG